MFLKFGNLLLIILWKKKMCIVGNAPVYGNWGKYIDSCDIVVRFNAFEIKGFEKKIGTKTDIWSYASNNFLREKRVMFQNNCYKECWILERSRITKEMNFHANKNDAKITIIDKNFDFKIKEQVKHFTSTGLVSMAYAVENYQSYKFKLIGFNFFKRKKVCIIIIFYWKVKDVHMMVV